MTAIRRLPPSHAFLARQMKELAAKLSATLPRVRQRTDDEAIHDMRVAIRRLRVVLKLSRRIFGRFHVDAIRESFTRVHRASGVLRDEEVLRETLTDLELHDEALDDWIARRSRNEERLRAIIEHRLRLGQLRQPLRELKALLTLPVQPKRRFPLVPFALEAAEKALYDWIERRSRNEERLRAIIERRLRLGQLRQPLRELKALLTLPVQPKRRFPLVPFALEAAEKALYEVEAKREAATPEDVLAMHALRIAYKRLRYTTEIFAPALPFDLAELAEPAARFQKRLGEIHDLDVARAVISRARTLSPRVKDRVLSAIAAGRTEHVQLYLETLARR